MSILKPSQLLEYEPSSKHESSWNVATTVGRIGTVVPRSCPGPEGNLLIAGDNGIHFFNQATNQSTAIGDPEADLQITALMTASAPLTDASLQARSAPPKSQAAPHSTASILTSPFTPHMQASPIPMVSSGARTTQPATISTLHDKRFSLLTIAQRQDNLALCAPLSERIT